MDIKSLEISMEQPIYSSLGEIFEKAGLTEDEKGAYLRNKQYCEYWLLRSKRGYHQSFDDSPNFIQRLARVIICLESDLVEGNKKQKLKELFGNAPVHKVYKAKNGVRSTQKSSSIQDTYFELLILSFFVNHGFRIELIKSKKHGQRIPEFFAIQGDIKLAVEAKNIDIDKILDSILGDVFIEGIDHVQTKVEKEKGYTKIKAQIENNYRNAIGKFEHLNSAEQYIIFMSIHCPVNVLGALTRDYFNQLQGQWAALKYENFLGVIVLEDNKTVFFKNPNCRSEANGILENLGITDFHKFQP